MSSDDREDRPVANTELDSASGRDAVATSTAHDPASYDPVEYTHEDIPEVPSAAWGWSGESNKAARIAAIVIAAFLLFMIHGNHTGKVEDAYLVGFAVVLVGIVIRDIFHQRKPR